MKKIFYGLLALVLFVVVYVLVTPKKVSVETFKIERGPFLETFSSDGKVHTRDKKIVYAFANGSIDNLDITLGQLVKKGKVVGMLDWDKDRPIKIPIDGVISKIFRDSAGPVTRGEPLFEVSNLATLEVTADVLTPDVVRLSVNGEAWIQNWGGAEDLEAKIRQISRAGVVKTSALGVEEERTEVRMEFIKVPEELKIKFGDNYHVDVLFVVSREANALSVPLGALFKDRDQWAVYVLKDEKAKLRDVKISKRNDRFAMVTDGLHENEEVILFPGDKIHDGTRVKRSNTVH